MPTAYIEYRPSWSIEETVAQLVEEVPGIVAPQLNISSRKLHDGGVGGSEIIVVPREYSRLSRNVNDIQITVVAHAFQERRERLDEATEAIKEGVKKILRDFGHSANVGVSIWLVEMGYATI